MSDNQQNQQTEIEPWMVKLANILALPGDVRNEQEIARLIADCSPHFIVPVWGKDADAQKIPCPACTIGTVSFRVGATLPFNSSRVSFVAMMQKPSRCDQCNREFIAWVTGGNLQCKLAEVEPQGLIEVVSPLAKA